MGTKVRKMRIYGLTKELILKMASAKLLADKILQKRKWGADPLAFCSLAEVEGFAAKHSAPQRRGGMGYLDPVRPSEVLQNHVSGRANRETRSGRC
jgi:hypothetical protein